MRFRGSDIKSIMPSVNPRASDDLRVIDGQNFRWDSRGPKSGFPSKVLSTKPLTTYFETNMLTLGPYTLICSPDRLMTWPSLPPYTWQVLGFFDDIIPTTQRSLWCGFYMNGEIFISQEFLGFYSGIEVGTDILRLTKQDQNTIPGLIPNIQGMAIVRGRGIIVNETTIQWSNTADMTDLTPGLGGAGFQVISQITKGTYVGLSTYEDGFIVYTTAGGITADYIGGDAVWRFDQLRSIDRPIEKGACTITLTGDTIYMSSQGVKMQTAKNASQDIDPAFNEYLRGYLEDSSDVQRHWRLEYDYRRQQLFIMESTDLISYNKSFVCHPTLGRWGIFNDRVMGFGAFTNDKYGYIDMNGIAHEFTDDHVNEIIAPSDSRLSLRQVNRDMYAVLKPANGVLHIADVFTCPEYPINTTFVQLDKYEVSPGQDGWYVDGYGTMPIGIPGSLNSWIQIGYFRPPDLSDSASRAPDIQKFIVQGILSSIWSIADSTMIADNVLTWYNTLVIQDYMTGDVDEDWNTFAVAEDWDGQQTTLTQYSYSFTVNSSFDGIIIDTDAFSLSKFYPAMQVWTGSSSNVFTTVRLDANAAYQYFHVQYLESDLTAGANIT